MLKFLQLLCLFLPLPAAILAVVIADQFRWTTFLAAFVAIISGYAGAVYLAIFGRQEGWQEEFAKWLRIRVLLKPSRLLILIAALAFFVAIEVAILVHGPRIELRGIVLYENRPIEGSAIIRIAGSNVEFPSAGNGDFRFTIADKRQEMLTLIATYKELSGKRTIARGAFQSFEVSLDPPKGPLTMFFEDRRRHREQRPRERTGFLDKTGSAGLIKATPSSDAIFPELGDIVGISGFSPHEHLLETVRHGYYGSIFGFEFLSALVDVRADADRNNQVALHEAVQFARERVFQATEGRQTPILRGKSRPFAFFSFEQGSPRWRVRGRLVGVLVGINEYSYSKEYGIGLRGSVHDVQLYNNFLREASPHPSITLLMDADATREAIMAAVQAAAKSAKGDDVLLFCYSGHLTDDKAGGFKALVPVEARPGPSVLTTAISLSDVADVLRKSSAAQKLIVLN